MNENPKLWEGQVVDGRFPLLQYLGGGPRSAAFATATGDSSLPNAAIKLVETDPEDAEVQLAQWTEAAALWHPHLLRLFQTGRCQLDGTQAIFVVMERADEDLSQVLSLRPLSAAETSEALEPVLEGLAYLHAQGLVHGRLRPSNILAVGDQLKLSSDRLLPAGESRGRRDEPDAYDAPETAGGEIGPAADVWSLGVILVEALTQQLPGATLPRLPAPFDDIARHCLQPDPRDRWTFGEIQARLKPPAATPAPARRVEAGRPAAHARGRYGLLAVALAVVLALAAILAVPRFLNRRAEPQTPEPAAAAPAPERTPPPERVAEPSPAAESPSPSATPALSPSPAPPEEPSPAPASPSPSATPAPNPSPAPPAEEVPQAQDAVASQAQGAVASGVLQQVLPEVPAKARRSIHGSVKVGVKVRVNASGSVEDAQLASQGPSSYFAGLAVEAARQWKFSPLAAGGQAAPSQWLLHFEFDSGATRVQPERMAP